GAGKEGSVMAPPLRCLVYCPLPYTGHGWPETCVNVIANFPSADLQPVLVTPRARKKPPATIAAVQALPFPVSKLPWRYIQHVSPRLVESRFRDLVDKAQPGATLAYFWPGTPRELVAHARNAGIVCVREMINTFQGTAKRILDDAYDRQGFARSHSISDDAIAEEKRELLLYDHVFASNGEVERSLVEAGVDRGRILPTSYGWIPQRFGNAVPPPSSREGKSFKALFVGSV